MYNTLEPPLTLSFSIFCNFLCFSVIFSTVWGSISTVEAANLAENGPNFSKR